MKLAKRIRELRIERGLSHAELAETLNLNETLITNWENGGQAPRIKNLILLADYFDVTIDYLIGRTDS